MGSWATVEERVVLTLISLHHVQVFRLLLKTSVERNTHELNVFFDGLCNPTEPGVFVKSKWTVLPSSGWRGVCLLYLLLEAYKSLAPY